MRHRGMAGWQGLTLLTMAIAIGCGGSEAPEEPADVTGSIEVTTVTSGEFPDTRYELTVNGVGPEPLVANGTEAIGGLQAGTYALVLTDVATNCSVTGGDTRSVTLGTADTARVTIEVICSSAPTILSLQGSSVVTFFRSGAPPVNADVALSWADPEGNVDSVIVTLVSDRNSALGGTGRRVAFVPDSVAGRTSGTLMYKIGCMSIVNCTFGPGRVVIGHELIDKRGQLSARRELEIEVTDPQ